MDDIDQRATPPSKAVPDLPNVDWEGMSVDAIQDYIENLRQEIAMAERQIAAKQSQRGVAENLFKS